MLQLSEPDLDFPRVGPADGPQWYAVYTRSRHERTVKGQLDRKGIQNFLPLQATISQWKDRRKQIELPLFPGYIFVKIFLQDRLEVLKTFGTVSIVGNTDGPIPVPDHSIASIQKFIEKRLGYDPHPYLAAGHMVRIINGPLDGVTGILVRRNHQCRLVISVDLIQRSISVEIDSWKIEPI